MTEIVLILITLALLLLIHLMRTLFAVRIPAALRLKPTKLKQAPDIMADLFLQADQALSDLGFSRGYWASVQSTPPLAGLSAPLMRLYHHERKSVIARVSPPYNIFLTDRCEVVFISISKRKTFLVTTNRVPNLFPRPPQDRAILINTRFDTLAEQFGAHIQAMSLSGLIWIDRSKERGEATWVFRLANRYEAKRIQWLNDNEHVKRLADGSAIPRIGSVLGFILRLVSGRETNSPKENASLPPNRAAYLFHNWQQANHLPLPIATQLGLFLGSVLIFVLFAGLFWDWSIAFLLLVVIGLHEAGHWLAVRFLGCRHLQIVMLPLVGGVTAGQEIGYNAAQRILVCLMGPLPGIILGTIILWFDNMEGGWVTRLGIILLVVNYLNLLPFMPLDGGQLVKNLIPKRRFGLLITLQWLGTATLLTLGWLSDSLFLITMALLLLFSGLALMKRKRVLDALEGVAERTKQLSFKDRITSVIQAIDQIDKTYRPLSKKAWEISELLTTLRQKPVTPNLARALLAIYLAAFLLPPITVFATSPGIVTLTKLLFSDGEAIQQETHDRAMALPMPQLVIELAQKQSKRSDSHRTKESVIIRSPATRNDITRAEKRLGTPLDKEHRQFLETSNGFINQLNASGGTDYLFLPVEQVVRFGRALPEIVKRLRAGTGNDIPPLVHIVGTSLANETKPETLNLNQIAHMLIIGYPHEREYLLLDPLHQPNTPASLLVIHESSGSLEGRRFKSLRHYLIQDLLMAQSMNPDQSLSD